ncbi:FecR family protein [Winogradskyella thalassocola]|uniref:Ferric-dicitrate binding protein FerR, regulates iron transport through sigma-19 n=1 Tax=Winogradskyella thalassocola TaxID=262004 RepID=A0A1G7WEI8_9FLAO|nr:FecR family protein [Winogradskyella thalassocola]SDG70383.1 ferric-dicitrate binding protein FerR, regulates iron transport through sigma-19 [Winogradskyella thalassocola]
MINMTKNERKCVRYLTHELSTAARAVFEIELTLDYELKTTYENYKLVWDTYPASLKEYPGQEEIQLKSKAVLSNKNQKRKVINSLTIGLAAITLIFIAYGYFSPSNELSYTNQVTTNKGQRQTVYLPDSSLVVLNALSEIKYNSDFKNQRRVYVKGEAYFDVTHNEKIPFIVHTEDLNITVLGTAFNVSTVFDNKSVSLERGKVNVLIKASKNSLNLLPKEELIYNTKTSDVTKRNFNITKALAWKENMLILDNLIFKRALYKINNFYGVSFKITDEKINQKKITGAFKEQNIDEFINSIEFIADVKIKKVNHNEYLITQNHED